MNNLKEILDSIIQQPIFLLVIAILAFITYWKINKLYKHFRGRYINQKGKNGEQKAVKWLKKHGFIILNEQEIIKSTILVDSKVRSIRANPDVIAMKDNENWVIEVKTGGSANINKAETRRQIRENACLYPESKIGFFDADKMILSEIEFPELDGKLKYVRVESANPYIWFSMGLMVGGAIIWFIK